MMSTQEAGMSTRETARVTAQRRANVIGEPVMVVANGPVFAIYEGDPMDLRSEYRIVETVEPK